MFWQGRTGTRLTLNGMYEYEPLLFNGLQVPIGMNKENLIGHIIQELGELYPYHQNADWLRTNITLWSERHYPDWKRMYDSLYSKYDPIENYNRHEWEKTHDENSGEDRITNGGTDTVSNSGSDVETLGGTDRTEGQDVDNDQSTRTPNLTEETNVSAFDADTYQPRDQVNSTGNETSVRDRTLNTEETTTYGKTDTLKHGKVETTQHGKTETTDYGHIFDSERKSHMHGNIGVTTTQEMITQEMELRTTWNLYNVITYAFSKEFLVEVY